MAFNNSNAVFVRLRKPEPLNQEEIAGLLRFIPNISDRDTRLVWTHLALMTMQTSERNSPTEKKWRAGL